jgi:hypothetical protein
MLWVKLRDLSKLSMCSTLSYIPGPVSLFFFCARKWTLALVHVRQAFYHWATSHPQLSLEDGGIGLELVNSHNFPTSASRVARTTGATWRYIPRMDEVFSFNGSLLDPQWCLDIFAVCFLYYAFCWCLFLTEKPQIQQTWSNLFISQRSHRCILFLSTSI